VNVLFALALLIALVIALVPSARQKAAEVVRNLEPTLQKWDDTIIVNAPSINVSNQPSTPAATLTPAPTAVAGNDEIIPNTGDEDSGERPIIQINWDALGDALRKFWNSLLNIKIDLNPNDNK